MAYRLVMISLIMLLVTGCSSGATPSGTPPVTPGSLSTPAGNPITTETQSATTAIPAAVSTATAAATASVTTASVTTASATAPATRAAASPTAPSTAQGATATAAPTPSTVNTFPDPSGYAWVQVASGVSKPTGIAFLPDAAERFLVLGQVGVITLFEKGQALPAPFLDISSKVGSGGNEQGLLGIALHPQFEKNGYFFINYTGKDGNTVIARYQVSAANPNQADAGSEKVLLRVEQPFANHNGGSMVFGPEGYLYMGLGDGGSAGDPHGNGQALNTDLGKLLRVDVDHGDPYAIPDDNPFAKGGGKPEVWAYGLRNPWRFSFDRLTGDLYIADVGQNLWEEIDYLPAKTPGGTNFGWNYREGKHPYQGNPPAGVTLTDPVFDYSHTEGCSVTGGYVYRGSALPAFQGIYLFADYCSGRIWGLLRDANGAWQSKELFRDKWNITSFGQDTHGELYFVDQGGGGIWRLQKR